jgi:hypothetical protein
MFGLNRDRFVGDLRAMPTPVGFRREDCLEHTGFQAISMPIENFLE